SMRRPSPNARCGRCFAVARASLPVRRFVWQRCRWRSFRGRWCARSCPAWVVAFGGRRLEGSSGTGFSIVGQMSAPSQPVKLERRGAVGLLTIDRPDRRNALSRDTLYALGRLGRELVDDPAIRAIVLTGAGDKVFCAGADLKERQGMSTDEVRK